MFEYLKPFNKIVVVGPGRSGTRIGAKIIAHELKRLFVDEGWFSTSNEPQFLAFLLMKEKMVIQAPNMTLLTESLGKRKDLAIVLMRRKVEEILESEQNLERFGLKRGFQRWCRFVLSQYGKTEGIVSEVIYDHWDKVQKFKIRNAFELKYEDLKNHSMFIKREDRRKHFISEGQTNIADDNETTMFQNTHRIKYRWTPSYTGEKIRI